MRWIAVVCAALLVAACSRAESAPGMSTYSPGWFSRGGMAAAFEGALALDGGCVGLTSGGAFVPLVVPDDTFRWDGTTLLHGPDRVVVGGQLRVGGGLVDSARVTATHWGQGCQAHPQVILVASDG